MEKDLSRSHPFAEKILCEKVTMALEEAKCFGADHAEVLITEEKGFSVSARNGDVETVEHHQERGMAITVYHNQQCGTASTSDLSPQAISSTVEKACSFARYAGQDKFAGLADAARLAKNFPDLDLYHHWNITPAEAIELAIECEAVGRRQDQRIIQCESADVNTFDWFKVYGNTHGFLGAYPLSRHGISISLVAKSGDEMQRDYEYTTSRRPEELDDVAFIAKHAAEKTVKRLGARKIKTQVCPVIFHAPLAKSLIGAFIGAISGGSLYRKASFLVDHLHKRVFPDYVHIFQEPHLRGALGSMPFDSEGVATQDLDYVKDGILTSYVLSSYSSRKLGMQTTGNAGGVCNLSISHTDMNLLKLMQKMGKGLLVTELMGQGVNIVTGDYSRGAIGYWVENGEIQYPVDEITIAGNLQDMFATMVAVGNDVDLRGNVRTGSILLEQMTIAGH